MGFVDYGDSNLIYYKSDAQDYKDIFVKCSNQKCLIDISFENFNVSPHIGVESAVAWLEKLISMQKNDSDKAHYSMMKQNILDSEFPRK